MSNMLTVKNLSVRFGGYAALEGVSFDIKKGDFVAVIGPNGAGKTVLFRAILGLLNREGEVHWPAHAKIGYVPQKLSVEKDLPLTVLEFLRLKNAVDEEVYEALGSVGLLQNHDQHHLQGHLLNVRLGQLSGGELQKVLIAYALINHPDILLFDEPTAGVDIGGEETIYSLLGKLHSEHDLTVIMITHDLNMISRYAKSVLCLNKKMVYFGPPKGALEAANLGKLYGENVSVYIHDHHE